MRREPRQLARRARHQDLGARWVPLLKRAPWKSRLAPFFSLLSEDVSVLPTPWPAWPGDAGEQTVLARIVLPSTGLRELWDALASRVPSTEVVAAHQWFDSLHPRQCLRKQGQHLLVQQSLPVLPEAGVLPDGIVCSKSHKPSVQHVVVQLFRQQSLGTQAVDGLQQQHPSPTARVGWTDDQRRRTTVTRLVQTLQCLIPQGARRRRCFPGSLSSIHT